MKNGDEQKTLLLLRDAVRNKDAAPKRWHYMAFYCAGGLGIVVGYWAAVRELLDVRLAVALAAIGGAIIGVASFYTTCQKQSRFTLLHLSLESIQKRLRELGT